MIPISGMSSLLGLKMVDATQNRQLELIQKEPRHSRAIQVFRERIADIETVDQLIADHEVYSFVMRAFDLEDQIFGKALIGKMLKSDVEDRKSLVNRLTDTRLKTMFETLGFEPGGEGNANTTDRVWQERIVALYIDTQFVNAQGEQNTTVGIALEFRRKASSIETGFDILKDPEMSNFMRTILGFPKEMAQVDIDKQAKMFEAKYDFSKLQDPAEVERLIRRFVIVSDALDGSALANNAAVQLISGTLGSLGDGTFIPATIDITAISAIRGGY